MVALGGAQFVELGIDRLGRGAGLGLGKLLLQFADPGEGIDQGLGIAFGAAQPRQLLALGGGLAGHAVAFGGGLGKFLGEQGGALLGLVAGILRDGGGGIGLGDTPIDGASVAEQLMRGGELGAQVGDLVFTLLEFTPGGRRILFGIEQRVAQVVGIQAVHAFRAEAAGKGAFGGADALSVGGMRVEQHGLRGDSRTRDRREQAVEVRTHLNQLMFGAVERRVGAGAGTVEQRCALAQAQHIMDQVLEREHGDRGGGYRAVDRQFLDALGGGEPVAAEGRVRVLAARGRTRHRPGDRHRQVGQRGGLLVGFPVADSGLEATGIPFDLLNVAWRQRDDLAGRLAALGYRVAVGHEDPPSPTMMPSPEVQGKASLASCQGVGG